MASPGCPTPNRYLIAIAGLLVIMAISITMAVMFPYVESDPAAVEGGNLRGSVGGVEIDGAGVLEDDAPSAPDVGGGEGSTKQDVSNEMENKDENTVAGSEAEDGEESPGAESVAGSSGGGSVSGAKEEADEEVSSALESTAVSPSGEASVSKEEEGESSVVVSGSGGGSGVPSSGGGEDEQPSDEDQGGSAVVESALGSSPVSAEEEFVGAQPAAASGGESGSNNNDGDDNSASSQNGGGLFDHGEDAPGSEGESTTAEAAKAIENEECRSLLHLANTHFFDAKSNNNIMDSAEYATFLASLLEAMPSFERGSLPDGYEDLPEPLKSNFVGLSCACPKNVPDCCAGAKGIYIDEEVLGEAGLDTICDETLDAMGGIAV